MPAVSEPIKSDPPKTLTITVSTSTKSPNPVLLTQLSFKLLPFIYILQQQLSILVDKFTHLCPMSVIFSTYFK